MTYSVGSLVAARGREWVVLPGSEEDFLLLRPLSGDEDEVAAVLPRRETVTSATFPRPTIDDAGDAHTARLLRSALRLGFRASGGPFRSLAEIAVTPRPYQLVPLLMALRMETVRLLISDDVGIGKTIEAGLVAAELRAQGDVRRLAVLCSPHLAPQWQAELREKFNIEAVQVLSSTVRGLERGLRTDERIWDRYPNVVVSTDFIKQDRHRDDFVRHCPELLIVDEAHTCVEAGAGPGRRGSHRRYELLKRLAAQRDRHLILVTATPHSGNPEAFRNLLGLLDPWLGALPDDLAGERNRHLREQLAGYFVQRRRGDIRAYLDEDTSFPKRDPSEVVYEPTEAYGKLFERVQDYVKERVSPPGSQHTAQQRVRWWSMLALLRCLASSPRAAAATLNNRAASAGAGSPEEADELGRQSVLDLADDEAAEGLDTTPGTAEWETGDDAGEGGLDEVGRRHRDRLRNLAAAAKALEGKGDAKLAKATGLVRGLLDEGFHPIVFCRYIPTADYVAEHLTAAFGVGVTVRAVTGALPPAEREHRIARLAATPGRRVLVASDCLAEGLNLQEHFTAVVHYDLAWNPTRHEQREGRVDRFGQQAPKVRTVTLYGNNPIDPIVIEVLVRKHELIRKALGVSVPVPSDSNDVVEAVMEGLLLRGESRRQLSLELFPEERARRDRLHEAWDRAKEKEERSRSLYAQHVLSRDKVRNELTAARAALGDQREVRRFVTDALGALGARVDEQGGQADGDGDLVTNVAPLPQPLRDLLSPSAKAGRGGRLRFKAEPPTGDGEALLARTDLAVEAIAQYVLDTALDTTLAPGADAGHEVDRRLRPASRCGVIRTSQVHIRTVLLLARFRFHLRLPSSEQPLLAEEARVLGFRGLRAAATGGTAGQPVGAAERLADDEVERLLDARPEDNLPPAVRRQHLSQVLERLDALTGPLEEAGEELGAELREAHYRVRRTGRLGVRNLSVELQRPVDVLGVYVYLPPRTGMGS